jgi:hypothetical protein
MTKAAGHSGTRLGDSSNPPYSPDLAPSDYHLFCPLSNNLSEIFFNNGSELQNWVGEFIAAKPADFFKRGIENLPECWEAVVNIGGEYCDVHAVGLFRGSKEGVTR